jgi:hypothetical protein
MYHRTPVISYDDGDPASGGMKAPTRANAQARLVLTSISPTVREVG